MQLRTFAGNVCSKIGVHFIFHAYLPIRIVRTLTIGSFLSSNSAFTRTKCVGYHHLIFRNNHIRASDLKFTKLQNKIESKESSKTQEELLDKLTYNSLLFTSAHNRQRHRKSLDMSLDKSGSAKWHLKNVFHLLRTLKEEEGHPNALRDFTPRLDFEGGRDVWICTITVMHPSRMQFRGRHRKKTDAENEASKKALEWLQDKGVLGYDFKPVAIHEKKKKQNMEIKKVIASPLHVEPFSSVQQSKLEKFFEDYNLRHKSVIFNYLAERNEELDEADTIYFSKVDCVESYFNKPAEFVGQHKIHSMLSGRPLKALTEFEKTKINNYFRDFMQERERMLRDDREYARLRREISKLPIHKHREDILDLIFDKQVVVISGETGSGKTTQIPQFILEDMIQANYGSNCSIIITQPRRLAAISVAEQTAVQFGEGSVGRSFGYHVRFDSVLPSRDYGSVLFCTTGILLRKMSRNPYLLGVSHLIIDEVHEREFLVDIIFVLLKKVLEKNKYIRIILMSASLNARQFSQYFNNCPVFEVEGRLFPVTKFYLEDIEQSIDTAKRLSNKSGNKINPEVVADLISHINVTKKDNDSILCFLPGWNDIKQVDEALSKKSANWWRDDKINRLSIIPVHSMLNAAQQKEIFKPLQNGVRKVILSTNIAETSLTVPDVVYVIDPGLCNEIFYHKDFNVSTFGTHWISRANAKQREGRAGRVRPGVCYKLYSKDTEQNIMSAFPVPEILRIPLESVIMLSKLYCSSESVINFLSQTMQPPSCDAIEAAVQTLKSINVLNESEKLTQLGKKIIDFTTHPRLSVCLVNASMLGCVHSMLNLTAMLSTTRDPFDVPLDNRQTLVRQIKTQLSNHYLSDYFALTEIVNDWESDGMFRNRQEDHPKYYIDMDRQGIARYTDFLSKVSMESTMNLKKQYAENLRDNGLLNREHTKLNLSIEDCNRSKCLIGISLVSGLYPNILKFSTNTKINKNSTLIDVNTGQAATYTSESVLYNAELKNDNGLNSCSIYFNSFFSEDRRRLMIKDAAILPPLYILLVIGKHITIHSEDRHSYLVSLDGSQLLTFNVSKQDLDLIMKWKEIFYTYQEWYLVSEKNANDPKYVFIRRSYLEFIDLTYALFERYAKL